MRRILCLLFLCGILVACTDSTLPSINSSTDFVASLNTIEHSIDFISKKQEVFKSWKLDEPYTGFTLVSKDYIFLYGYSLNNAVLIQLSTGKIVEKYFVHEGTSNAYVVGDTIYVTNGKENMVTLFDLNGKELAKAETGSYPMSMIADEKYLYVVNFKDTFLSVFTLKDLHLVKTWDIPNSSHGLYLNGDEIWIGGHGAGSQPNKVIRKYSLKNGELEGEIDAPMMPIGFAETSNGHINVVSHGNSNVREFTKEGELVSSNKVGANPFSINTFDDAVVVAGYDDHEVYFLRNGKIINKVQVGKGPFQLITREASK